MIIYYTSDTHFFHANIIKYCNRPFQTALEMNEVLINNWNSKVSNNDIVYFLGDFAFNRKYDEILNVFNSLNGVKHLISGNHDEQDYPVLNLPWASKNHRLNIVDNHTRIFLSHYPHRSWDHKHKGGYHFFGHCHGTLTKDDTLSIDVGVDAWDFYPVTLKEIEKKIWENVDPEALKDAVRNG